MRMHANGEPFDPDLGVGVSFARFDFAHRKQGKTQIAAEVGARHGVGGGRVARGAHVVRGGA